MVINTNYHNSFNKVNSLLFVARQSGDAKQIQSAFDLAFEVACLYAPELSAPCITGLQRDVFVQAVAQIWLDVESKMAVA